MVINVLLFLLLKFLIENIIACITQLDLLYKVNIALDKLNFIIKILIKVNVINY